MLTKAGVLLTGGRGYIGSHMAKKLVEKDYNFCNLDNLNNKRTNILIGNDFIESDVGDQKKLDHLFTENQISTVFHLAGLSSIEESYKYPERYYDYNIAQTISLLNSCIKYGVQNFIFSSTATIFGNPIHIPINENHPCQPLSPYGLSKKIIENILHDYEKSHGLKYACLRYFNAAGADPNGDIGPLHDPRTHLVTLALDVALKKRKDIEILGIDYPTPDGTCIRDYIHVNDLCDAHFQVLNYLENGGTERHFNLGTGKGYSVLEIVDAVRDVTKKEIFVVEKQRRKGDPVMLVADAKKAFDILNWSPQTPDIFKIIEDAWRWELKVSSSV